MEILNNINGDKIFRNLFENSAVGMSITTLDGKLHTNDAYCELLGYQQEQLIDRKWEEFTHPDDISYNKYVIENILSGKKHSDRWEKRYLHKDGSVIWVDIHTLLHRDDDGNPQHFITTISNITKRKIFEEALSTSEQRFSTLIRQMNEGVAIIDPKGFFLFANHAAETILERDSLNGKNFKDIFGKELFYSLQNESEFYNCGDQQAFELDYKLADGTVKIVSGCATHSLKESDNIETFVLFRDITSQRRAEEEIKMQNEKLVQNNAEKDKFFAILAHDLRSPLSSFLGLTEVMAEDINDMTMIEIEDISKSLYSSASNLFQLLENLLEWSILQGGNSVCLPEISSLKRIILRSMEPVLESARRKSIELNIDLDRSYQVDCDQKMTETIFRNLISNALKYSHGNGSVVITAKPLNKDEILISVRDSGIGMSDEILSKLFILNKQINRKGTEGESSTGLGLLICKEFVERQGGKIWAESTEGNGSTFYFTLKLVEI